MGEGEWKRGCVCMCVSMYVCMCMGYSRGGRGKRVGGRVGGYESTWPLPVWTDIPTGPTDWLARALRVPDKPRPLECQKR